MSADDILEQIRALPERERLRIVERVVHEVVEQKQLAPAPSHHGDTPSYAIWADVSDDDFDAFEKVIRTGRAEPWRTTP